MTMIVIFHTPVLPTASSYTCIIACVTLCMAVRLYVRVAACPHIKSFVLCSFYGKFTFLTPYIPLMKCLVFMFSDPKVKCQGYMGWWKCWSRPFHSTIATWRIRMKFSTDTTREVAMYHAQFTGEKVNGLCHKSLLDFPFVSATWFREYVLQYTPRNMHTVFAFLGFVVVIHWLIFPYPSGVLHWHCGNLTIAPVPAKQPWWIWINTSCEFIMNDYTTTTKQNTTKTCAYFLGYTVRGVAALDPLNYFVLPELINLTLLRYFRNKCLAIWSGLRYIQSIIGKYGFKV